MRISDVAIKNPVFSWMLMSAIVLFGGIALGRLGVSQLPDVDFPQLTVTLTLEGAAPEVIESDVADTAEDAISTVEGVREIATTCKHGSCILNIEFDLTRPIDLALQDVQSKLAQAARRFPKELEPPVITKTNPEDQPIMWLGLSGPRPARELADIAKNQLRPKFQTLPGVAEVMMGGYLERNVRVWLRPRDLASYGLTAGDVVAALGREHVELPAGRIESAARERNVRAEGEAPSIEELRRIVVAHSGPDPVRLDQVAFVEDGTDDKRRVARVNGTPGVGFGIKKQRGANTVEVAKAVKKRLLEVQRSLPADLELDTNFDSTPFIEDSIHEINVTIVLAVGLTAIVCWLFLGSFSATFNILLSIPTSIVGTFAAMYFMNFTLNTFTLIGLSLAVGIVVDDAIMVLESIWRHAEMGKSRVRAASDGAAEISFAALAASVAIMAIFLPVAFMQGVIGRFFFQFGVTISVAVALSLIEALTLTPMRCSRTLDAGHRTSRIGRAIDWTFTRIEDVYRASLRGALAHPLLVTLASFVIFIASLDLTGKLGKELVPAQDQGIFLIRFTTPVGSSIDYTDELLKKAEGVVAKVPEVRRYFAAVGGFGGGDVNTAICFVTLKPKSERKRSAFEIIAELRKDLNAFPDLKAFVTDLSMRGFTSGSSRGLPVEFSVRGPDWEKLAELTASIMRKMEESGLMPDPDWDYLVGAPEVRVLPRRDRAADLAVDMREIGSTLNALVGGQRVARFTENGRRRDVRVRLVSDQRLRPQDIERLLVRSRDGALVRLDQIVDVKEEARLLQIQRKNRERAISVYSGVSLGASQADALAAVDRIAAEVLPPGGDYRIVYSGSAEVFQDAGRQLAFALLLGLVIAYMVLASQFNSYLHPVTVLLALPFAVTGAFVALHLTGKTLNLYSGIGLILLMGIVKKNSILLVDYANERRKKGAIPEDAMLAAGPVRLRPILMTTMSTMAGAVPAALTLGPGAELRAPMAVAVLGGVAASTILTLYVVPAFYVLGERYIIPAGRFFWGLVLGPRDEGAEKEALELETSP